jgi:hypothetical protein
MVRVPDLVAVFEKGPKSLLRCEVFKSDGDFSDSNWSGNRYVRIGNEFKLLAAIWDQKFVGFDKFTQQT